MLEKWSITFKRITFKKLKGRGHVDKNPIESIFGFQPDLLYFQKIEKTDNNKNKILTYIVQLIDSPYICIAAVVLGVLLWELGKNYYKRRLTSTNRIIH